MSNTIARELADELKAHIGRGEGVVNVARDDVTVDVEVEQSERYAVGVRGITVRPAQPSGDVRRSAERIVERVDALDEPLQVVEVDERAGRAVVRSAAPETDDGGVSYWEGDVQPEQTSLRRYRKDHAAPDRELITAPLPHRDAGRAAEQLADAVRGT
jgi:hypothetical protein